MALETLLKPAPMLFRRVFIQNEICQMAFGGFAYPSKVDRQAFAFHGFINNPARAEDGGSGFPTKDQSLSRIRICRVRTESLSLIFLERSDQFNFRLRGICHLLFTINSGES